MTTQLLIYETVVPLSFRRHSDACVEVGANYGFSRKINSVPLMAVEFPPAAAEYAIVFAGSDTDVLPAVILGMRGDENLYLEQDSWKARYLPAFVRRYPFVFSNAPDAQRFLLCVDEAFSGFNREGRGQRLFEEDGKPSQYVDGILNFLQEYQAQFLRTKAFCNKLRELDLLEPMQAQAEIRPGEKLSLTGFMAVNRARLKALAPEKLAELAKTDELELIYLHLQSMRNFAGLSDRLMKASTQAESVEQPDETMPAGAMEARGNGMEHAATP